jgi:hypothetical protein
MQLQIVLCYSRMQDFIFITIYIASGSASLPNAKFWMHTCYNSRGALETWL